MTESKEKVLTVLDLPPIETGSLHFGKCTGQSVEIIDETGPYDIKCLFENALEWGYDSIVPFVDATGKMHRLGLYVTFMTAGNGLFDLEHMRIQREIFLRTMRLVMTKLDQLNVGLGLLALASYGDDNDDLREISREICNDMTSWSHIMLNAAIFHYPTAIWGVGKK